MKLIIVALSLLVSLPSYSANYLELCEQQHMIEMTDALNMDIALKVLQKTSENLIQAFAMKGIVVQETDFSIMGTSSANYTTIYQINVYTPAKSYTFSAILNSDIASASNIYIEKAKDNAVVNSIGQILKPATEVTCSGATSIANRVSLQNDETGVIFRTFRINDNIDQAVYIDIKAEIKFAP